MSNILFTITCFLLQQCQLLYSESSQEFGPWWICNWWPKLLICVECSCLSHQEWCVMNKIMGRMKKWMGKPQVQIKMWYQNTDNPECSINKKLTATPITLHYSINWQQCFEYDNWGWNCGASFLDLSLLHICIHASVRTCAHAPTHPHTLVSTLSK